VAKPRLTSPPTPATRGWSSPAVPGPTLTPAVTVDCGDRETPASTHRSWGPPRYRAPPRSSWPSFPGRQTFLAACGDADASSTENAYQYGATDPDDAAAVVPRAAGKPDAVAVSDNGDVIVSDGVSAYRLRADR